MFPAWAGLGAVIVLVLFAGFSLDSFNKINEQRAAATLEQVDAQRFQAELVVYTDCLRRVAGRDEVRAAFHREHTFFEEVLNVSSLSSDPARMKVLYDSLARLRQDLQEQLTDLDESVCPKPTPMKATTRLDE